MLRVWAKVNDKIVKGLFCSKTQKMRVEKKDFENPDSAAKFYTEKSVDGWEFWRVGVIEKDDPGYSLKSIHQWGMIKIWAEYKKDIYTALFCTHSKTVKIAKDSTSPSSAAKGITKTEINGWRFWHVGLKEEGEYQGYLLSDIIDKKAKQFEIDEETPKKSSNKKTKAKKSETSEENTLEKLTSEFESLEQELVEIKKEVQENPEILIENREIGQKMKELKDKIAEKNEEIKAEMEAELGLNSKKETESNNDLEQELEVLKKEVQENPEIITEDPSIGQKMKELKDKIAEKNSKKEDEKITLTPDEFTTAINDAVSQALKGILKK